jgi:hypothetical protein
MEESTKKIFKPKFELVQECNGLVSIHLGKHAAAAILQGTEITGTTQEDHQMLVVCHFLETLPLTHWELGLKNCGTKQGIFYIIYQIAYVVNIQTSLRRGMFIKEKGSVVLSYQFLVLYLSSTQNI